MADLSLYLHEATGKPEVWIAALALFGNLLLYLRIRHAQRGGMLKADWDRMRDLIDSARAESAELRQEAKTIRKEAKTIRELLDQIKAKETALILSEFNLTNENANLRRRIEECEAKVTSMNTRYQQLSGRTF